MTDGDNIEGRLAKLEWVVTGIKDDTSEIIRHVKETNGRVGVLERGQWLALGAIGVIVFLMGAFGVWALTEIS